MKEDSLILELKGVRKRYGDFVALDGVDLSLTKGQVIGFLGPNGAGKTTTLRMITGLIRPTSGTIRVCGVDILEDPLRVKQRIGFISDRPFLYEKLTGGEFLAFIGGLWGMSAEEIDAGAAYWLRRFDLHGWEGEPVEAYSHGMRQRLLLCAALLHQPELLIMDEPMVGLDPRGAMKLKQVVRELARERELTVLLSTHTLDVVQEICDSVVIINRGVIVAAGPLEQVRSDFAAESVTLEELFLKLTAESPQDEEGSLHAEP